MNEKFKLEIRVAFGDLPRPKYDILTPHKCDECDFLKSSFYNQDWMTVKPEIIKNCFDKLPLFSDEGFHYFLPAYILYAINSMDPKSEVIEFLIYSLSPSQKDRDRFMVFSNKQLIVIKQFLHMLKADEQFSQYNSDLKRGIHWFKEKHSIVFNE